MATHTKDHRAGSLAVIVTILMLLSVLLVATDSVRANPGANPKAKDLFFGNEGAIRPGDTVPVYAKWQNTGDTNTTADIVLYVDYGSGDQAVDNVDDVFMEAGKSNTTELSWTPDREGTFNVTYKIENSSAGDDDANNNQRTRGFEVEPSSGYADLFIEKTSQDKDPVPAGEVVLVKATLGNYGNITGQVNISAGLFIYPENDDRPDDPKSHIPFKQIGRGEINEEMEFRWQANVEAGTYNFELVIDYDDNLSLDDGATDNDTSNNKDIWVVQVTTEGGSGSDLYFVTGTAEAFDYDGDAVEGEEVTFKYSIRNKGGEDSDLETGWNIAIYTKKKGDNDWSAEPVVVSNDIHDVAKANDGSTLTAVVWVKWNIPDDALGEYDLKVVIDYLEELDNELARSNNEMTWRDINGANNYFKIERKLPNLLVQNIVSSGTAYVGDNITISVYLSNNGDVAAADVKIDLTVTKTGGGQPSLELDDFIVGDVLLSEDTLYNWTWAPTVKGDYKIEVHVDPSNNITEKDDSDADNKDWAFFTVEEKKPDLLVMDSGFTPSNGINGILGANTTFWVHIQNKGLRALTDNEAKETYIIFNIAGAATTLNLAGHPLAVDEMVNLTVYYTFEREGSHTTTIDIDPGNLIPELDTENNDYFFTVYVDNLVDAQMHDARVTTELPQTNNAVEIAFNITMDYLPTEDDFDVEWEVQIFKNSSLGLSYVGFYNDTVTFSQGEDTATIILDSWEPELKGNYTLKLNVAYSDDTPDNNYAELYVYVQEFTTDLQIAEVNGISVDSTGAGDRTVTVVVGYAGNAPSVAKVKVWLKVYGTDNKPWSGDWENNPFIKDLDNQTVEGLIFKDQTRSLTFNWPNAVKGCYVLVAYVDYDNLVHEEDELNNIFPSVSKDIGGGCKATGSDDDSDDSDGFLPGLGLSGSLLAVIGAVALLAVMRRRQ